MDELTPKEYARLQKAHDRLHRKKLISRNPIWRCCQLLLTYGLVQPLLQLALPVLFGLKVENRSVLRQRRREGYVLVCNHVHPMDCTFLGVAAFPRNAIFTSQEETFYIRGLGTLLRLLNCVPVLSGIKGLRTFLEEMEHQLRKGRVVVVYPEGEIHVCCDHLRKFSDGAFTMATRGDVPVIPAVITPREATGFWKKIGRTYCVTLTIGQPIAPTTEGTEKQRIRRLREDTIDAMETMLEQGGHAYPKEDVNDKDAFWQVKKSKGLKK